MSLGRHKDKTTFSLQPMTWHYPLSISNEEFEKPDQKDKDKVNSVCSTNKMEHYKVEKFECNTILSWNSGKTNNIKYAFGGCKSKLFHFYFSKWSLCSGNFYCQHVFFVELRGVRVGIRIVDIKLCFTFWLGLIHGPHFMHFPLTPWNAYSWLPYCKSLVQTISDQIFTLYPPPLPPVEEDQSAWLGSINEDNTM